MHAYQLFIDDDRYLAPTLKLVLASNESGVREQAEDVLVESRHHISVAVYLNAARLFEVRTQARGRDNSFDCTDHGAV